MRGGARLFLDASVWIATAGSRAGASALVLELCRRGRAVSVSSRLVLLEAERNIRGKLSEDALLRFYRDIASLDLELVEPATPQEIAAQTRIINPKDVHVLAAAMKGNAKRSSLSIASTSFPHPWFKRTCHIGSKRQETSSVT